MIYMMKLMNIVIVLILIFIIKEILVSFVNLIYDNIDYENSSVILDNMIKNKNKEQENDINEYNDDFQKMIYINSMHYNFLLVH